MIHLLAAVPCLIVNYIAVCNFCGFAANGMPFVVRSRLCSVIRSTSRKNIFSVRVSMSARRLFHLLLVYLNVLQMPLFPCAGFHLFSKPMLRHFIIARSPVFAESVWQQNGRRICALFLRKKFRKISKVIDITGQMDYNTKYCISQRSVSKIHTWADNRLTT